MEILNQNYIAPPHILNLNTISHLQCFLALFFFGGGGGGGGHLPLIKRIVIYQDFQDPKVIVQNSRTNAPFFKILQEQGQIQGIQGLCEPKHAESK